MEACVVEAKRKERLLEEWVSKAWEARILEGSWGEYFNDQKLRCD